MAAVLLQVFPSFHTNYSKNSLFSSANTYEKYIVSKEHCISRRDDKMCFLPNCSYNIILLGHVDELNWIHFASPINTWTVSTDFSSTASVAELSRVDNSLIICRGQFVSTSKTEEWIDCPASLKTLDEKYKKHLFSSYQNTKSAQTSASVFADRIEQVKETKFELELIKNC